MEGCGMIKTYFWRIVISFIGILLIVFPIYHVTIGIIGETTVGTITSYRRILGERGEIIPNRYTYALGYEFTLENEAYFGNTTLINSPIYLKPDGNQLIEIRYLQNYPYLNALEFDTSINSGKFALMGFGILLIWVMNPKKKKSNKKSLLHTRK